jgi:DNA (cytosine-5)-methyltransferase 1
VTVPSRDKRGTQIERGRCGESPARAVSYGDAGFASGRPRLLDLFCGAGGAAMGYHRAGFDVVGVDVVEQSDYPFEFFCEDAVDVAASFLKYGQPFAQPIAAIHASPPCQAFTSMSVMWNACQHEDLLTPIRQLLKRSGKPYVIENVEGEPMENPVRLCGSSLGLGSDEYELRRHRLFETNWPVMVPPCGHGQREATIGIYGDHARDRRRVAGEHHDRGRQFAVGEALERAREAMEMPWASWKGISQAIPPAYTEYLGTELMRQITVEAAA